MGLNCSLLVLSYPETYATAGAYPYTDTKVLIHVDGVINTSCQY